MRLPLLLPDRFTWGIDAGRVQTPASAGIDPDHGYGYSQRVPPKLLNYIHKLQGEISEAFFAQNLRAWCSLSSSAPAGVNIGNLARIPNGLWVVTDGTNAYYSPDAVSWSALVALPVAAGVGQYVVTETDGMIIPNAAKSGIMYSADGVSWSTKSPAFFSSDLIANRGTDDYFITADSTTLSVYIWAIGASGSPVSATTPPTGTKIVALCGGDAVTDWYCMVDTGTMFLSTDSGDTWAATAGTLSGFNGSVGDCDYADGVWIAVGQKASPFPLVISRSTDEGGSWAEATIHNRRATGSATGLNMVRALGGGRWVAVGKAATVGYDPQPSILISVDAGLNWYPITPNATQTGDDCKCIWCDSERIVVGGDTNLLYTTNPISIG